MPVPAVVAFFVSPHRNFAPLSAPPVPSTQRPIAGEAYFPFIPGPSLSHFPFLSSLLPHDRKEKEASSPSLHSPAVTLFASLEEKEAIVARFIPFVAPPTNTSLTQVATVNLVT